MTLYPPAITETIEAGTPRAAAIDGTAWGSCDIRLLADRVASRRSGSTHKVYREWRFAATLQAGVAESGTTLFTIPVDPALLATSQSRYAMVQLANEETAAGGSVPFSWSASVVGASDPMAVALEHAQHHLQAAGWTQDAKSPTHYTKSAPAIPDRATTNMPSIATPVAVILPANGAELGTPRPHLLPIAMTALQPEAAGLDEWETDGGTCSTVSERSLAAGSRGHR